MRMKQVSGWLSDDGKFFDSKEKAEIYETRRDLIKVVTDVLTGGTGNATAVQAEQLADAVLVAFEVGRRPGQATK
jgi:hypothetical protein